MVAYIFTFLKLFVSVWTLATTDVKPYRQTNAPTSGSFAANFYRLSFNMVCLSNEITESALNEGVILIVKVTFSFLLELFDVNNFESDKSKEKNYKRIICKLNQFT